MDLIKRQDEVNFIATLLHDVSERNGLVFDHRALKLTLNKLNSRVRSEGFGFLTKTLPKLCKGLDKTLAGGPPLNSIDYGFKPMANSKLPKFLGEFFSRVLCNEGNLLPNPCEHSVKVIREICYLFYKYELPYSDEQEQEIIARFVKTEQDISNIQPLFDSLQTAVESSYPTRRSDRNDRSSVEIVREARILLQKLFANFDPKDIVPRHGPGTVATKQLLSEKYRWTNISSNITRMYPAEEYYYASLGHFCDRLQEFQKLTEEDLPARVVLVPKDSRGPRLISCEPVDYQWIQQGLSRAIVRLVEEHPLTKERVNFTDQSLNQFYAFASSRTGRYATLDLNEASDRVSVGLVRLLFPENVFTYLMACRSSSTILPDGKVLPLSKFAPMGSALCFPVLALTVWSLLAAGLPDAFAASDASDILVYGDDVIVPTAQAAEAMHILESFGLKINRDKSCTSGLFRESCGMDAFNGYNVTPVRFRTVWSSSHSPEVYSSWISYANSMFDRQYYMTYDKIVRGLHAIYGAIPDQSMGLPCISLKVVSDDKRPQNRRYNKHLQKMQVKTYDLKSPSVDQEIDGWSMFLRYCVEAHDRPPIIDKDGYRDPWYESSYLESFSVRRYTRRRTSMLVKRWQ